MNYAYWLATVPGVSDRIKRQLICRVGSAEEIYFLEERQLAAIEELKPEHVARIVAGRKRLWEENYDAMCAQGITFLSLEDPSYPQKLKNIPDPPYGIYIKGPLPKPEIKTVAIVGARMCSEYGRAVAEELGRKLAMQEICVVSGMARGIDTAGHQGVLQAGGITCAVLGCGVDVCYPKSNRSLYESILERGCIMSEYPPGIEPLPAYFPARNRIIAGMSDAVVVVEAKARSGSLITADQALEQGRDIYAVPGGIYDALSAGCNNLIHQGAGMLINVDEFIENLAWNRNCNGDEKIECDNFEKLLLEKEERLVYSCVDLRPKSIEEIRKESGIKLRELLGILAKLQQRGFITETFKNCYIRRI